MNKKDFIPQQNAGEGNWEEIRARGVEVTLIVKVKFLNKNDMFVPHSEARKFVDNLVNVHEAQVISIK